MKTSEEKRRAEEIGARIALARREAQGMTQRELADLLGVTERSVAAYEAGEVIPYRFMHRLEELLNRPANWLLYGETRDVNEELRKSIERLEEKLDRLLALKGAVEVAAPRRRTRTR